MPLEIWQRVIRRWALLACLLIPLSIACTSTEPPKEAVTLGVAEDIPPPDISTVPAISPEESVPAFVPPPASAEAPLSAPPEARVPQEMTPPPSFPLPPLPRLPSSLLPKGKVDGRKAIVLDPGHGGSEVGAVYRDPRGGVVVEKHVNLEIALILRDLLEAEGLRVVLTRDSDRGALVLAEGEGPAGYSRTRADLQARVDIANAAQADLFISIHNNGSSDPSQSGTEVWYSKDRPFWEQNIALAQLVQSHLVAKLRSLGHNVHDRGIKDDSNFRVFGGRSYNLFVLGPAREELRHARATQMPGVLGETLFITNPREATLLQQEATLVAIAEGYRDAILDYFQLLQQTHEP